VRIAAEMELDVRRVVEVSSTCGSWSGPRTPSVRNVGGTHATHVSSRSRENYYLTRCCCSWPLLRLPLVQGRDVT
jgi:hypothetical protein